MVAQIANGLLLPIIAFFLLYAANSEKLMSGNTNGWVSNSLGIGVVVLTVLLSARQFNSVWEKIVNLWSGG